MSEVKNNVITVDYKLYRDTAEGEMIESTEGNEPMVFLSGVGQMIPDFENNVNGLTSGQEFSFGIKSENAYGTRKDEAIVELSQDLFMKEGKLAEEVVVDAILPRRPKWKCSSCESDDN